MNNIIITGLLLILLMLMLYLNKYTIFCDSQTQNIKTEKIFTDFKINPFSDKWNNYKPIALKTLKIVTKILNLHQIDYFLGYGTLLGFERHGDLIPWDDDIDLIILDNPIKIQKIFRNQSNINLVNHKSGIDKVFLPEAKAVKNYNWSWPFIDLFYAGIKNNQVVVYWNYNQTVASTYAKTWILPIKERLFYGFKVKVPNNTISVLQSDYGNNYLKNCVSSIYNHSEECKINRNYKVKCHEIQSVPEKIPTFVINLEHRRDRKQNVSQELAKLEILNPIFIKAINASDAELREMYKELPTNKISIEEIACGLSHIKIWQHIVSENLPIALILEDDIAVPNNITYQDLIQRLHDSSGASLVLLGYCGGKSPIILSNDRPETTFPGSAVCLHAYFLTLFGAKRLLKKINKWDFTKPIDWITENFCQHQLCFLSTSIPDPRPNYFGHGLIFQNKNLGSDIANKIPLSFISSN